MEHFDRESVFAFPLHHQSIALEEQQLTLCS